MGLKPPMPSITDRRWRRSASTEFAVTPGSEQVQRLLTNDLPFEVIVELDRKAAIQVAVRQARAGDVVVVAGKGHEQGQEVGGVVYPFDDRTVLRAELAALTNGAGAS